MRSSQWTLIILMSGLLAISCRQQNSDGASATKFSDLLDADHAIAFNLAEFVAKNDHLQALRKFLTSGTQYLEFGDKNKFMLRTNMTVVVDSKDAVFAGSEALIQFWADGWVFKKRINSTVDQGGLLDIQLAGSGEKDQAEGYVRFLGQEKLHGKIDKNGFEQTFTRDLSISSTYYPVPLLGLGISGNLGGEMGIKLGGMVHNGHAVDLNFAPTSRLTSLVSGKIELLKFIKAEAIGAVDLLDVSMPSKTSIYYLEPAKMFMQTVAIDGTSIHALDGKITVGASASLDPLSALPAGVDPALWSRVADMLPFPTTFQWQWRHILWNPAPVIAKSFPNYMVGEYRFSKPPATQKECLDRAAILKTGLDQQKQAIYGLDTQLQTKADDMATEKLNAQIRAQLSAYGAYEQVYMTFINDCNAMKH